MKVRGKLEWEEFLEEYEDAYDGYKSAGATELEASQYAWVDVVSMYGVPREGKD